MRKNIIFIALIIGIIFCSISVISATNYDATVNQTNDIYLDTDLSAVSNNSNIYSINNINVGQSVDDNVNMQVVEGEIKTIKQATYINDSDITLYFNNGTLFKAYLYDEMNNPLQDQIVNIEINGVLYSKTTNEFGGVTLWIALNPGTYNVKTTFEGTILYNSSNSTSTVVVLPTISGNNITKYYINDTHYYATFLDGHGNPLVNATVSFNINGVFYYKTTDENGTAKLGIYLSPNTYILTAIGIDGYKYSNIIKVLPTIESQNLVKAYLDNNHFYATFLDGHGNPLVNATVLFNINGVFYYKTTDENGTAKLGIYLRPNSYILTACNTNDGLLRSYNVDVLIDVNTIMEVDNVTLIENSNQTIPLVFYDGLGYTVPNMTVSLLVYNTWYSAVTNNDGIAYFNVNLTTGNYNAYYQFNGTNVYAPSGVNRIINVQKGKEVIIDINDNIIYRGDKFSLTVKDSNNVPLENITTIIIVNGVPYTRITDSKGVASLGIYLNSNIYEIMYYVNQTGYNDKKYSNNITVISNNVTSLSSNTSIVYQGEGQNFDVKLSADGVPLQNQKVSIIINGVPYIRTTDSNGVAHIAIYLAAGNYTITVTFNGTSKLKPVTKLFNLLVSDLSSTKFTVTSGYDIVSGNYFSVKLSDFKNNSLANKNVIITINGVDYDQTTNGDGVAAVKVTSSVGIYDVTCKFNKEYPYVGCEQVFQIRVIGNVTNGNGYWVFGKDMYNVNLASLSSQGTGNIFLNYYAFTLYGEKNVLDWIKQANSYGVKVHIWMQSFNDGSWILPVLADGTPNYEYFNQKIDEAKYYAGLEGVGGIHLDYLRVPGTAYKHPGTTEAINEFVKLVDEAVTAINPSIILSAAVMPETTNNIYFYGQDVEILGKYLDVIVPMVYKGNYKAGTSWITTTTKWFVDNSQGAQIWTGLQAYQSDDNVVPLSIAELTADAQAAINGGAVGAVMFRWGVTNFIDFNSLDYPHNPDVPTGTEFTASEIKVAAKDVKTFMEENGVLPNYVTVGNSQCSVAQFLYLMAKFVPNYKSTSIAVIDVAEPINPANNIIRDKLTESNFITTANSIVNYMETYKSAPESMDTSIGSIPYSSLIYGYARIINFIADNNALPAFVYITNIVECHTLTVVMMPSVASEYKYIYYKTTWLSYCPHCGYYGTLLDNPKKVYEGEITCAYCDCDYCGVTGKEKISDSKYYLTRLTEPVPATPVPASTSISLKDIESAALYVKGYYEANGEIPATITISDGEFTAAQYLYLVSKAITNIGNSNFSDINILEVSNPSNPVGDQIDSSLDKSDYLDLANRVATFIEKYNQAPNYASSSLGRIIYVELVDSLSRVLAYYANNGILPSTVNINYGGGSSKTIADLAKSLTASLTTVEAKATALFNYVRDYISYSFYYNTQKGAEGTLASGSGNCCDQAQLLVAMARAVNLTARFATGNCKFTSGSTYGHVWVQFLVDGKWVVADPTSTRNSFGVIRNWDTSSYVNRGTYDVLPY